MATASGSAEAAAARSLWLEGSAVKLSLWLGGAGLALCKAVAYWATGSTLVRTSMFESLGDVISSFIMFMTQRKMNDARDVQHYPVGKGRFQAIGVLFFCAFMCSSMSSMAIDSIQELLSSETEEKSVDSALRRLFSDHSRLRLAAWSTFGPNGLDQLIAEYGDGGGGGDASSQRYLSMVLLSVCTLVKLLLWLYCRAIERLKASDIVGALGDDHRNDTMSCLVVIFIMGILNLAERRGWDSPWLAKLDPFASMLLAGWIVYGWVQTSLEQISALSDRRADDEDIDMEAMREAVERTLKDTGVACRGADVYHVGEGFRTQLRLVPVGREAESIARTLSALEGAIREANEEVYMVDMRMRPCDEDENSSRSWVKDLS